jgi:hypothetical protein
LFVYRHQEWIVILWMGTYCFGLVMGWLAAYLYQHGRPGWRESKVALGVLFGAALQSVFGSFPGLVIYGIGVFIGLALYGVTLLLALLRHAHSDLDE